jgi:hypothetical protein
MVAGAQAASEPDPGLLRSVAGWDIECVPRGCVMTHTKISQRYGAQFEVYLTAAFERSTGKSSFFSIDLPPETNSAYGVDVVFADLVGTGADQHSVTDSAATFHVPFTKCDEKSCVARIMEGMAKSEAGQSADVVALMSQHGLVMYRFKMGEDDRDVLDSLGSFKKDQQTMLADLKKPQ